MTIGFLVTVTKGVGETNFWLAKATAPTTTRVARRKGRNLKAEVCMVGSVPQ